MQWNPELLDKNIAPGISAFTQASIPDVSSKFPQADYWMANHFLNSVLRTSWGDGHRQIVVAYLRRATQIYRSYNNARKLTLAYLDGNEPQNPRIGRYYDAVAEWENFAIDFSIACDLLKWFNGGKTAIQDPSSSPSEKLRIMGHKVKHLPSDIKKGVCTQNDTVPLWITSEGLNSFGYAVTYDEAAKSLCDLCELADEFQDARIFRENTRALASSD